MKMLLLLFFALPFQIAAQTYMTVKDAPPKAKDAYHEAYKHIAAQNLDKGIREMEKVIKKYPKLVNGYLVLGDSYRQLGDLDKAIGYFQQAADIAPEYDVRVFMALGQLQLEAGKYVEAKDNLEKFMRMPNVKSDQLLRARRMAEDAEFRPKAIANPVPFVLENLGAGVNTKLREYFPSVTVADDILVYTVQTGDDMRHAQEDLYYAIKDKETGKWGQGQPMPNVNTEENEGAQAISADGKLLVFTACNRPGDYGSCDLYFSQRLSKGEWSKPKNIGAPVNSREWESQPSVAPNGDAIYFARGSREGQKDLYVTQRQADGSWGKPEPLAEINTPFNETAPCMHPDGQTLYFASDGYAGMGSFDLFVSRKGADGKFGKPVNLGYPLNTNKAEESIVVSLRGDFAFLSSDREGGQGLLDLYSFALPKEARPQPVTYTEIVVRDAVTKKPIPAANLEILNITTEQKFLSSRTDRYGELLVCLPLKQDYAVNIQKAGYLFHSEQFALNAEATTDKPFQVTVYLRQVPTAENTVVVDKKDSTKQAKPIVMKNVFFATNSAELRSISRAELDQLKALLDENPKMRIRIQGHTDSEGDDAKNKTLSENRAKSVRTYLIEKGIAAERLESAGFGETQPVDTNDTPAGRANNRRTEFLILSN